MELSPEIKRRVTDPKDFPYTPIVERIFNSAAVQKEFGFSVDEDTGALDLPVDKDEFKRIYAEILTRTQSKGEDKFDSRTLSDNKATIGHLRSIWKSAKKLEEQWSSSSLSSDSKAGVSKKSVTTKTTSSTRRKKIPDEMLIKPDFDTTNAGTKLQMLLEEMKMLKINLHLQSSGILLRSALDIALMQGMRSRGQEKAVRAKAKSKYLKMSDILKCVLDGTLDFDLAKDEMALVKEFAGENSFYSLERLNSFVHGQNFPADYTTIIAFREKISPIISKAISA